MGSPRSSTPPKDLSVATKTRNLVLTLRVGALWTFEEVKEERYESQYPYDSGSKDTYTGIPKRLERVYVKTNFPYLGRTFRRRTISLSVPEVH